MKYRFLLLMWLTGLTFWSCEKENIDINLQGNDWEIVKLKKQGESSFTKAPESYILKFISESSCEIKLDVNDCGTNYEIPEVGKVSFEVMFCTEICCDSDFARDFINLLPGMTTYYGRGKRLILEGAGEIVLHLN